MADLQSLARTKPFPCNYGLSTHTAPASPRWECQNCPGENHYAYNRRSIQIRIVYVSKSTYTLYAYTVYTNVICIITYCIFCIFCLGLLRASVEVDCQTYEHYLIQYTTKNLSSNYSVSQVQVNQICWREPSESLSHLITTTSWITMSLCSARMTLVEDILHLLSQYLMLNVRLYMQRIGPISLQKTLHPRKQTWIITQNDGLAKATPFKIWAFLVSMLDFWGVLTTINN